MIPGEKFFLKKAEERKSEVLFGKIDTDTLWARAPFGLGSVSVSVICGKKQGNVLRIRGGRPLSHFDAPFFFRG